MNHKLCARWVANELSTEYLANLFTLSFELLTRYRNVGKDF